MKQADAAAKQAEAAMSKAEAAWELVVITRNQSKEEIPILSCHGGKSFLEHKLTHESPREQPSEFLYMLQALKTHVSYALLDYKVFMLEAVLVTAGRRGTCR